MIDAILKEPLPLLPIHMKAPQFGCSAIAVRTKSGDRIFGRNFDYNQFAAGVEGNAAVLMRVRPKEGYSSVGMVPGPSPVSAPTAFAMERRISPIRRCFPF